ncbi:MAG: recombination protein RecR [Lentisphaerae bacterium]|nr:recombination protein RecR [Lentisphaerota bacterium]
MFDTDAYPKSLQRLIGLLARLPGIGRRSAERLALALLDWSEEDLRHLGESLVRLRQEVQYCTVCGNFSDGDRCVICSHPQRQTEVICVVETAAQIPVFERSGGFHGLYHVLGGRIAPLQGIGPEALAIEGLRRRLAQGGIAELILATSPDVEGEATAAFLANEFADSGVRLTRLASGVPVGADLSYADAATLASALGGRRAMR